MIANRTVNVSPMKQWKTMYVYHLLSMMLHSYAHLFSFQLIIKDITSYAGSNCKGKKDKRSDKVLLSEFENPKLALFAKCCARLATCLVTMCPEDALFSWPTFTEEFERLVKEGRRPDFVASLEKINDDSEHRDKLVRFVSDIPKNVACSL